MEAEDRVIQFLLGLNVDFIGVRGQISIFGKAFHEHLQHVSILFPPTRQKTSHTYSEYSKGGWKMNKDFFCDQCFTSTDQVLDQRTD